MALLQFAGICLFISALIRITERDAASQIFVEIGQKLGNILFYNNHPRLHDIVVLKLR